MAAVVSAVRVLSSAIRIVPVWYLCVQRSWDSRAMISSWSSFPMAVK